MPKLKTIAATRVEVTSRSGANKMPHSGYATFSDGKYFRFHYDFGRGVYTFDVCARGTNRSVVLPRREAALKHALDCGNVVDDTVIRVKF